MKLLRQLLSLNQLLKSHSLDVKVAGIHSIDLPTLASTENFSTTSIDWSL